MSETPGGMLGIVLIGRDEGVRLQACMDSVLSHAYPIVYVDSGSKDNSVVMARSKGVEVVILDKSLPFTAARARNAGFELLLSLYPGLSYVQFVDGDCVVCSGWLDKASLFLNTHCDVAVVCGRRRERYPHRSIYNLLCDIEWDTPVGESKACGGDAMMRVDAFLEVEGFRADLIAGEEPELCVRLRTKRWKIWRIAEDMTCHDASILNFGQWWKREVRGGYAFANAAFLHGDLPERHRLAETRRNWVWGLGIPLLVVASSWGWGLWAAVFLIVYPAQVVRLAFVGPVSAKERWSRALFLVVGKFPQVQGQIMFYYHRCLGRQAQLVEYKAKAK